MSWKSTSCITSIKSYDKWEGSKKKKYFFRTYVNGEQVNARTGCLVMMYTDPNDSSGKRCLMHEDWKELSFPGGVAERHDRDIEATVSREFKEEILLKDFKSGFEKTEQLIKNTIIPEEIRNSLPKAKRTIFSEGGRKLAVVYYIIDISTKLAKHLINEYQMCSIHKSTIYSLHDMKKKGISRTKVNVPVAIGGTEKILRFRSREWCAMHLIKNHL